MSGEHVTGLARLHALIYSLLFPGLLAAFILTQFTENALVEGFAPWSWLLCLYFAVQFVEGHETKANYRLGRAIVNLVEMAGMVLIFAALGYFPDLELGTNLRSPDFIQAMMAIVFALPALYRLIWGASTLGRGKPGYKFARSLTAMSLLAAVLSGFFADEIWAWVIVLSMLLIYMFAFQFCNDWLIDKLEASGLSWSRHFRRP